MSKRRAKRRGGTLSVSIIVIAFLVVMVVQVVQLKQKESTYAAQKAELEKQYTKESERADEIESMQQYMQSDQYIEDIAKSKLGLAYDNEIIFKESTYAAQKAELEKQYTKESERADEIESMQQYMQSDQYIEDIAKSKLGLAYDNEIIFKEKDK